MREGDVLAAPATSYSRNLIEYMTTDGKEQQTVNQMSRRYTRAGLPECVVSTMSGPPLETTKDRTKTKDTHPVPR